jgi:hypothetical protein
MDSDPSNNLPRLDENVSALLEEVDAAIAMIRLAETMRGEALRRLYQPTKKSYELTLTLLPGALRTMSDRQERAMWARLASVREWIESTALRLRAAR